MDMLRMNEDVRGLPFEEAVRGLMPGMVLPKWSNITAPFGDDVCRLILAVDHYHNGGNFHLSGPKAAELLDREGRRSQTLLWRYLRVLTSYGVLELVRPGGKKRANTYRLILNPDGSQRAEGETPF